MLLLVAGATLMISCKSKEICDIKFPVEAAFVGDWGESTTLTFTYKNAESITVTATTGGWSAEVDKASRTLIVTAPASESAKDANRVGSINVAAVAKGGDSEGAVIYACIVDDVVDLSANNSQSNSYIVARPNVKYRFNASVKGNSTESIPTAKVGICWTETNNIIRYLNLEKMAMLRSMWDMIKMRMVRN